MAETLWLADLAVTYMGSDPIRAWDRVTNLYDELNLPKLEAVPRTDAFFGDFAENELFKRLIGTRYFPNVFRKRWNDIYRFFHEGNPSTQLNRTISNARKMYSAVNMEIGMRKGDMLRMMAVESWSEYFIGISKDQSEVFRAKSVFAELDPQNASAFWGDTERMLPSILDKSIDNFFLVLPAHSAPLADEKDWASFSAILAVVAKKLVPGGTFQILTDLGADSAETKSLLEAAAKSGFERSGSSCSYFPENWQDPEFKGAAHQVIVLARGNSMP
jgi:tRNA G46 methylase TrmB